eukprot:scaffold4316_cov35-Tisochrysis_lutea.AAC.2
MQVKPSRFSEARWLSDLINTEHTNPKYLPGVRLPDTVIAEPDLAKAASQATLVIIAVPHHYLHTAMFTKILSGCAPNCRVCSLVKGLDVVDGRPSLVSDRMRRDLLGLDVAVLMGANIAEEVAASQFSEATLGTNVAEDGPIWQRVFNTENFRVNVVLDATGVELCGALKPIISLGAGFCDGMDCGALLTRNCANALNEHGLPKRLAIFSPVRQVSTSSPQAQTLRRPSSASASRR